MFFLQKTILSTKKAFEIIHKIIYNEFAGEKPDYLRADIGVEAKMRKKKSFIILIAVLTLCMVLSSGIANASEQQLRDNNYNMIDYNFRISETGYATVEAFVYGVEGETEKIRTEIQIKKKGFLGLFWNVVDIGVAGNIWMDDSFYNSNVTRSVQLDSEGTYKACFKFTIRDFGGESETLSMEIQREY